MMPTRMVGAFDFLLSQGATIFLPTTIYIITIIVITMTMNDYVNLPVKSETKKRFDDICTKSKTYDEFVNELLDLYEQR